MHQIHNELRKLFGVGFDESEIRWCVFGTSPDGEGEWAEFATSELAEFAMRVGKEAGYNLQIEKLTRGEIRQRFGNPELTLYADRDTQEYLFAVAEGDNYCGIANLG